MSGLVRMSVSVESELLERIDQLCDERHYASRSDAFRRVFYEALTDSAWQTEFCEAFAVLTLVCNCSCSNLTERLTELQHGQLDLVVSTTRVYVDNDTRLEVIILRGGHRQLNSLASRLCGVKGVQSGKLVVAAAKAESGNRDVHRSPRT